MTKLMFVPSLCLVFTLATIGGCSSVVQNEPDTQSTLKPTAEGADDSIPKTCDGAAAYIAEHLDDDGRKTLRYTPRWNLIQFHHGFGANIRSGFGLWGGNPDLLASCAQKVGLASIHPDNASSVIIDKVWSIINSDLPETDWNSLSPTKALEQVNSTLKTAYEQPNCRLLLTLPEWVFRSHSFEGQRDEDFSRVAREIAATDTKLKFVALLYLSYFPAPEDNHLFESLIERTDVVVNYPHIQGGLNVPRFRIDSRNEDDELNGANQFFWKTYTLGDIALRFLGERYGEAHTYRIVEFKTVDDFRLWQKMLKKNYLFSYSEVRMIQRDELDSWLARPLDLLKLFLLSDEYVDQGRVLPEDCYMKSRELFKALLERLPWREKSELIPEHLYLKNESYREEPSPMPKYLFYVNDQCAYRCDSPPKEEEFCWQKCPQPIGVEALTRLAATIPAKELLESISPEEHQRFLELPFNDVLRPFILYAYFIIASEFHRLNAPEYKDQLWELCEYYIHSTDVPWQNGWDIWPTLLSLQFKLDKQRTDRRVRELFDMSQNIDTCEGNTTRYLYLDMMTDKRADEYVDLIEEWYTKRIDGCENAEESEAKHLLGDLYNGAPAAEKLWEKLTGKNIKATREHAEHELDE